MGTTVRKSSEYDTVTSVVLELRSLVDTIGSQSCEQADRLAKLINDYGSERWSDGYREGQSDALDN